MVCLGIPCICVTSLPSHPLLLFTVVPVQSLSRRIENAYSLYSRDKLKKEMDRHKLVCVGWHLIRLIRCTRWSWLASSAVEPLCVMVHGCCKTRSGARGFGVLIY